MPSDESARYFEDVQIGDTMEHGEYRVTKAEIVEFAQQYDPQPFHVDEELATESMFGELIASGWHTAAICMRLLVDGRDDDTASAGARGVDDLRWHKPVRPGDVLSVRAETVEKRPSRSLPGIGHVNHEITGLDDTGDHVITWTALALVERRNSD